MNLCEILKAIELNTSDINSIKNNSESAGIYLVVIKATLGGSDGTSYEVTNGDFNTAKSKLQAGEYIDVIIYKMTIESGGEIIQYSYKPSDVSLVPANASGGTNPEFIGITWGNNMMAFWTESDIFEFGAQK